MRLRNCLDEREDIPVIALVQYGANRYRRERKPMVMPRLPPLRL